MFGTSITILIILLSFILFAFGLRIYYGGVELKVACAGDVHMQTNRTQLLVNLKKDGFVDENNKTIDYESYNHYSVCGKSMLLTGIEDGDLLFVKPYKDADAMSFPCVVVIQRDHYPRFDTNVAQYKVRRSWAKANLSTDNLGAIIGNIMDSKEFKELISTSGEKKCFMESDKMREDFFETRWKKYKKDYPSCEKINDKNNIAVISTTLDTKTNIVHFSIHPFRCIKGEVMYSFGLKEAA